ncbi:MAG: type II toxin-antitoxin system VapC family toxin [Bacillota bacterium]
MSAVIDASVVVRAVLPGQPHHDAVHSWLSTQQDLLAPRLIWYEVTTAIRRLEHAGVIDTETGSSALEAALQLRIRVEAPRQIYFDALSLARALQLSRTHDAVYLAVARLHRSPLVTLDERLLHNARSHGYDVRHPAELAGGSTPIPR